MRFTFLSFATLALTASAVAAQPAGVSFNPPASVIKHIDWSALPATPAEPATNAKRLAQGLPLKPPTKRRPHRGGPHRDGSYHRGTRVVAAPRAQTSPSPSVQQDCNILATASNGSPLGYIAPKFNDYGEYGALQEDQDGSLLVSFSYTPGSNDPVEFISSNGPGKQAYPFVGASQGFSTDNGGDFGPGSYSYAYISGTTKTDPGSPPVTGPNSFTAATDIETGIESVIWRYNPATYDITAQWINGDGSAPPTFIASTSDVLVITGDVNAFAEGLDVDATELRLKCVPPNVTPARL